ncbi:MAG: oxaloacetate decarboxylase [Clostridia bacterium]|nr:oxaloacetate decarboxylase [Clostridia bacterium]
MDFGFYPDTLRTTLPIMGMGMLGIFLVTCIIVLAVVVLSKFGKQKEE